MFRLLRTFSEICEENGLRYFVVGGTLIGAVRHRGFIPWDDDIDVSMPLDDFRKFTELARELPFVCAYCQPLLPELSGPPDLPSSFLRRSVFFLPMTCATFLWNLCEPVCQDASNQCIAYVFPVFVSFPVSRLLGEKYSAGNISMPITL